MPLNEIEQHPYLNYFISLHNGEDNVPWEEYTRMFIGSFPVYPITKTIYPIVSDRSITPKNDLWNFFYGSETNDFWEYLLMTFDEKELLKKYDDLSENDLINFLESKNILLTDAVYQTNRFIIEKKKEQMIPNPISPADAALMNESTTDQEIRNRFKLNTDLVDWLQKAKNIDSLYFTAKGSKGKTPGGWLHNIFSKRNVGFLVSKRTEFSMVYDVKGQINRTIKLYFLPTPSASRSINMNKGKKPHMLFSKYVKRSSVTFFQSLEAKQFDVSKDDEDRLKPLRDSFVREWWYQYIIMKHYGYDGSNPR